MRMLRWFCDQAVDGGDSKAPRRAVFDMQPSVAMPMPMPMPKRKRSESDGGATVARDALGPEHDESSHIKRIKSEALDDRIPALQDREEKRTRVVKSGSISRVRDAFEFQFSLDILRKHDELRLINQELGKCQVALEQLRRCHLIPYPVSMGTPESMLQVMNGSGPALQPVGQVPRWAPSYGITDGPYSRHYARWLIPEPSFDGQQPVFPGSRAGKTVPEGRSTRNSIAEGSAAIKARGSRGSTGEKLQALSSGYPQIKEKGGPCIMERKDGTFVKLVCLDCNRSDFSSVQGFINHCRIAHGHKYEKHEDAAAACGKPLDEESIAAVVSEEKSSSGSGHVANGLVHPLITSDLSQGILSKIEASKVLFHEGKHDRATEIPTSAAPSPLKSTPNASFVPSFKTPHLSALMQKRGFGSDLSIEVDEAKISSGIEEFLAEEDDESPVSETPPIPQTAPVMRLPAPNAPGMRVPASMNMAAARRPNSSFAPPVSSKGIGHTTSRTAGPPSGIPRPPLSTPGFNNAAANLNPPARAPDHMSPADSSPTHVSYKSSMHMDTSMPDVDLFRPPHIELSPNTSNSNNAPSLVSDDGEYNSGEDDADSVMSHSEREDSVAEIDIADSEMGRATSAEGLRREKEEKEKHVTFVSTVKKTEHR